MRKRRNSKEGHSTMTLWVILIVVFMAELLVYSWCRVQYVHTGYEITEARQESQVLIALQQELTVEEARLRSPERIRQIAEKRGLTMPDLGRVFVMP
jgi:cell division protein FtsL